MSPPQDQGRPPKRLLVPQWLTYRLEPKPGQDKPAKIPHYTDGSRRHGKQGSEADRRRLVDYETALKSAPNGAAGFAFLPNDGLAGVDLDNCRDPETGEISKRARDIIAALDSYTELSPSGRGFHIFVSTELTGAFPSFKNNEIGVEVFCQAQFFTWTGRHHSGTPHDVRPLTEENLRRLKATVESARARRPDRDSAARQDGELRDDLLRVEAALVYVPADEYQQWIDAGHAVKNDFGDRGFPIWDRWSRKSAKYPGPEASARRWASFNPNGSITSGTIFELAKRNGFRPGASRERRSSQPREECEEQLPPEFSEDALAREFTRRHGDDLRYVAPRDKWLRYDGKRWAEDRIISVYELARGVARDAAKAANANLARKVKSAKTIAAIEKIARSDPRHATLPEQLDADLYLFNTPGGTVDLRTGELRPHRREDLITKLANATPDHDAGDAVWMKFLADITLGDEQIQDYLQRLFGYGLSADVRDHVLAFFYGTGGNGKNTLIDLVLHVMGNYAKPIGTETLMEARGERHPTDIANLLGVHLAVCNEVEEGRHWSESRIKGLTGDAMLVGRFMRQDYFEFKRTHKLIVAGNHRPVIRVVDEAMRRRIHLVPFKASFTGKADMDMPEKLKAEAGAVLAWMVRGFLGWQAGGLQPPSAVLAATEDYLATQDTLGLWLAECCDTDPAGETRSGLLYGSFKSWKEQRGERPPSQVRFTEQLEQRFHREPRAGYIWFQGVSLKARPADPDRKGAEHEGHEGSPS